MIGAWKKRIEELRSEISSKQNRSKELDRLYSNKRKETLSKLESLNSSIDVEYVSLLTKDKQLAEISLRELPPYAQPFWKRENWDKWQFGETNEIQSTLCFGAYKENNKGLNNNAQLTLPAFLPFIGKKKTIIIEDNSSSKKSIELLQSLALRIAFMLPHQTIFTFIDPTGFGKSFPFSNQLKTRENSGDDFRTLENAISEMRRIISTYGLSDSTPFDAIAENILINEQFEFIFAADFPKGYDRRTIEKLQAIGNTGSVAGKYLFIHHNTQTPLPRDIKISDFENAHIVNFSESKSDLKRFSSLPDSIPEEQLKTELLNKLKDSKPPEKAITWEKEILTPTEEWWRQSATEFVQTSIGRSGSKHSLDIWFGAKKSEGNRPCAHGMLGAMTGSGKSNLYHALILGLSINYSPEEVSLYLIDGKDGVEFQPYKSLPHAEVVSLKSLPQLSRSILAEVINEKERRNELFTTHGVSNFEQFKQKNQGNVILPRIVVLIDEYQELFEGDRDGEASKSILSIAAQGRSAGIHLFLGSQKFGVVGMLHQQQIFGNIHLRVAMKMALSDRNALTEFGREGKQFIGTCDLPGKVVLNDESGEDGANKLGKVALISSAVRDMVIDELVSLSKKKNISREILTTNVFNGNEQPNMLDNPFFHFLLNRKDWLSPSEFERFAKRSVYNIGLNESGWFAGERPIVAWLGQEFNVRGFAKVILRRRRGENIVIVGDTNDSRYGMLGSVFTSIVLNSSPETSKFIVFDKSISGTLWSSTFSLLKEAIAEPLRIDFKYTKREKDVVDIIDSLSQELNSRKELDEEDRLLLPNIFLFMTEIDRIDDFMQTSTKYGTLEDSELTKRLKEIISKGSSLGIYVIISFEGVMALKNTIGVKSLEYFKHRVALQMSEDDAFNFTRKRTPSKLQENGAKPISSYYLNMNTNKESVFKPYTFGTRMKGVLQELGKLLLMRR